MMTLKEFSLAHRLRIKIDGCGDSVIPGRATAGGSRIEDRGHVYDLGDGRFGVCLLFATARKFGHAAKLVAAAGFTPRQIGQSEGVFLFDPTDSAQASAALKACGIKKRRIPSPAQLATLEKARKGQNSAF
jgi:hypothetical protein